MNKMKLLIFAGIGYFLYKAQQHQNQQNQQQTSNQSLPISPTTVVNLPTLSNIAPAISQVIPGNVFTPISVVQPLPQSLAIENTQVTVSTGILTNPVTNPVKIQAQEYVPIMTPLGQTIMPKIMTASSFIIGGAEGG